MDRPFWWTANENIQNWPNAKKQHENEDNKHTHGGIMMMKAKIDEQSKAPFYLFQTYFNKEIFLFLKNPFSIKQAILCITHFVLCERLDVFRMAEWIFNKL